MNDTLPIDAGTQNPQAGSTAEEAHRVRQGISAATSADVLTRLATDPSVRVRAALALNPAAPPATLGVLARDADARVRALLAARLASLTPQADADLRSQLYQQAMAALALLVEDEVVRVRAAIAEAVKDMPDAPRDLVLRLARDSAIEVSEPVILLSPLLTQGDLLGLLAGAGSSSVALAVARRPHLTEPVSDVIARSSDAEAIRALLSNSSAQIREATLDALIADAAAHVAWHEPLVRRHDLSPRAAQALSQIVTDTLLAELAERADLGQAVTEALRERLARARDTTAGSAQPDHVSLAEALTRARALAEAGQLTEACVLSMTAQGEARLVAAMLAVAADVPYAVVERAISLRSPKGLTSLAWKAGFSMRAALALQGLLARLGPNALMAPGPGGTYPLTIEEMRWQIEFLGRAGARG